MPSRCSRRSALGGGATVPDRQGMNWPPHTRPVPARRERRPLAGQHDAVRRRQGFAGYARGLVLGNNGIQNGIGNLTTVESSAKSLYQGVTLGLTIVRTSPDHGTAFDIAGRGVARPDSLIAAIRMADGIAARRAA